MEAVNLGRICDPSETQGKESVIQALSARDLQAGFEAWFHRDCLGKFEQVAFSFQPWFLHF